MSLALFVVGCLHPVPPAPGGQAEGSPSEVRTTRPARVSGEPAATEPDGGSEFGAVLASTRSGRFVALWWWPERPQFGQHGEPSLAATTVIRDLRTGTDRTVDELVSVGADRRFFLVQDNGRYSILSDADGAWTDLPDASPDLDANRCQAARGAAFAPNAPRVGWIPEAADRLVVRDLDTGETWEVPGQQRVWRGWPDDTGRGATLIETPDAAWPVQNTSCACRYCSLFAMSYGFYGWTGTFTLVAVRDDGTRAEATDGPEGSPWHGPDAQGCTLTAAKEDPDDAPLQRGPWRWVCR